MRISVTLRAATLLCFLSLLFSCSTNYTIVQSRRAEYPIQAGGVVDSSVIKKYLPYKLKMDSQMNQVIGYTDVALTKKYVHGESLLGNFFSDAALYEAKLIDPQIDFALPSTNGGLRNDLPLGPLTLSNVFELMPFENEMMIFELKGADVKELIDLIANSGGQPVSGITMKIVDKKAQDILIKGVPFDSTKNYRVLTSDYIAGGGDGVNCFKNPVTRKVVGLKVRDALIKYIKDTQATGKKITSKTDGRITNDQP